MYSPLERGYGCVLFKCCDNPEGVKLLRSYSLVSLLMGKLTLTHLLACFPSSARVAELKTIFVRETGRLHSMVVLYMKADDDFRSFSFQFLH